MGITKKLQQLFSSALTACQLLVGMEREDSLSLPEAVRREPSVSLVAAFLEQWNPNGNESSLAAKCNDSLV